MRSAKQLEMKFAAALGLVVLVGCGGSQPAPAPPTNVPVKPLATAPASRPPLFVEYVVIRESWVAKVMPVDGTFESDKDEKAFRAKQAPELARKLAADLRARMHGGAEMRPAIAGSVSAVLGDLASADEWRPAPVTVERDELKTTTRLPADAKAALGRFADGAKGGDVLEDPVATNGEHIVARAESTQR